MSEQEQTVSEQFTRRIRPGLDVDAYLVSARRTNGVDRGLLGEMVRKISQHAGKLVLVGWSDYAKHLVNVFGVDDGVIAIADDVRSAKGWQFRSIPVVSMDEAVALKPDHFVCTRVEDRVRALGAITTHPEYQRQKVHCFPQPYSKDGRFYDPWQHSEFYRELRSTVTGSPQSMLNESKIQFLVECLKQTLHLEGDVLEVGTWQGGSAWPLAKLLASRGLEKRLVLLDFFETLPPHISEGIMCLDEIQEWFSFYPQAEIHSGNVDQHPEPMTEGTWCFIHYDAGFNPNRLARSFGRLQPGGIMILDNYGHVAANPGKFDNWFAKRNHEVSTTPQSEQGWVFKHQQ